MSYLSSDHPPRNLGELLIRDVASLLITSHLVSHSVHALRPECGFSRELTAALDTLAATSGAGETLLHQSLTDSGAQLPVTGNAAEESTLMAEYFVPLPAGTAPGVRVADIATNLRMLSEHLELKIRLAAEEALLVGQGTLCHALMIWAAEWEACSRAFRNIATRTRTKAHAA